MTLRIAIFLLCIFTAGAAVAQTAQPSVAGPPDAPSPSAPLGLFGVTIGEPLDLPQCQGEVGNTDATLPYPAAHPSSDIDCWRPINGPSVPPDTRIVRLSDSTHASHANLRQDFSVRIGSGKVAGITMITTSGDGPEQTLNALKARFGEPSSQRAESGTGGDFKPARAEWRLANGFVNFTGGAPGYPVAVVEIESVAWHDRPFARFAPPARANEPVGQPPRLSPKNDGIDPAKRAAASIVVSMTTGVARHRVQTILELEESFLAEFKVESHQHLRDMRDEYLMMVGGAEFLLSPTGRALFAPTKPK